MKAQSNFNRLFCLICICALVSASLGCVRAATTKEMGMTDVDNTIKLKKGMFGASAEIHTHQNTKHILDIQKLAYDKEKGCFEVDGLHSDYNGDASTVVTAEVERMKAAVGVLQGQTSLITAKGAADSQIIQAVSAGILTTEQGAAMMIGTAISPLSGLKATLPGGVQIETGKVPPPPAPPAKPPNTTQPDGHTMNIRRPDTAPRSIDDTDPTSLACSGLTYTMR